MSGPTIFVDGKNTSLSDDTSYATKDHAGWNSTSPLPYTRSNVRMDTTEHSLAWCHDLQGSDFIYTPTLYSTATRHAIAVAFIFLIIITVMGNAFVILTVVVDKPLKKITRALVVSMAASDILVALCGELQSVVTMLTEDVWTLSDTLCEVFTSADLYFSLSGILHIVCLAGDRYLAICYPFKYVRMGRKYLVISVVGAWTLPFLFSFLPILSHWHRLGQDDLYACLHGLEVHVCTMIPNKEFSTVTFSIMFGLPCLVMGFCYAQIYRTAMFHKDRMSFVTLGSYTSNTSAPLSSPRTASNEKVSEIDLKMGEQSQDQRHTGGEKSTEFNPKSSNVINFREPCPTYSKLSEPSPGLDTFLNHRMFYAGVEFPYRDKTSKERLRKINSCPHLTIPPSPLQSCSFQKWSSLCQITELQQNSFFASVKAITANNIKTSSKCNVTFSLSSSVHIDKMGEISENGFRDKGTFEVELCNNNCSHKSKISKEDVHLKQVCKPPTVDDRRSRHSSLQNGSFVARFEKKKTQKKVHHLKTHKHGFLGEDFRTARSISIIIVCFAGTWCPYWVTMLIMPYLGPAVVPDPIIGASLWLAYVGSALNPFVYYFSNNSVKKGIKKRMVKILQSRGQLFY